MNNLCAEIGWKSINHEGEQLCGDHVDIIEQDENSTVIVLADGLGSGVKASILSTLTSKIISTMMAEGLPLEECVATIAATLPICSVRGVAYSTFTIIHLINNETAEIIQYDNPHVIMIRDCEPFKYTETELNIVVDRYSHALAVAPAGAEAAGKCNIVFEVIFFQSVLKQPDNLFRTLEVAGRAYANLDYHMFQTFARTFSLKKSFTLSGFTEKNLSSTVTHTPCWHLPMQKVPESSTLSSRLFSLIRYWSCSTTWRDPLMWQEEPMQTVIFIHFTSFTSNQQHRSTSGGIRAPQRCP